jgi:hypothetical protein
MSPYNELQKVTNMNSRTQKYAISARKKRAKHAVAWQSAHAEYRRQKRAESKARVQLNQ